MSEMRMLVILVVPPGANDAPICHAGESFEPYRSDYQDPASQWLVAVTPEAAVALLHKGGFSLHAPAMRRRLSGMMVRMIHKEGPRSCGWDGEAYEPDETGTVTVPVESQEDLFSHGFVGAPPVGDLLVDQPRSEEVWAVNRVNPEGKRRDETLAGAKAKTSKPTA